MHSLLTSRTRWFSILVKERAVIRGKFVAPFKKRLVDFCLQFSVTNRMKYIFAMTECVLWLANFANACAAVRTISTQWILYSSLRVRHTCCLSGRVLSWLMLLESHTAAKHCALLVYVRLILLPCRSKQRSLAVMKHFSIQRCDVWLCNDVHTNGCLTWSILKVCVYFSVGTRVQTVSAAKRLPCVKPIPPEEREHQGSHIHSLDPEPFHFCDTR